MKRLLIFFLLLLAAHPAHADPVVAAATSWAAAFARAAGAKEVLVIAPENLQHPADYDPKPSDLLHLRNADFVVLGGFEGFAQRLHDAAGSKAVFIQVHLNNDPETVSAEILRLGKQLGTKTQAQAFVEHFEQQCAALSQEIQTALKNSDYQVVAHTFMTNWADFAGFKLLDSYGPGPLQPSDVLRLSTLNPDLVLDNGHMPSGAPIAEAARAKLVTLINFPGPGMDLYAVFRANTTALVEALQ